MEHCLTLNFTNQNAWRCPHRDSDPRGQFKCCRLQPCLKVVNVGFHVYEDARGILGRNPSVRPGPGFAQIDAAWLGQYFR